MRNILDLLRKQEPTSADLKAAMAGLSADDGAATIAALEAKRRKALLEGHASSALESIEREITEAKRERDRVVVFREELAARIATAEQVEAIDALDARKSAAERDCKDVAKLFERFEHHVVALAEMIGRSNANVHECREVNRMLLNAGSTDRVHETARKNFGLIEDQLEQATMGFVATGAAQ